MVTCTICKKSFKNTQGLRGHNFFVHNNNRDLCAEPAAQRAEQSSSLSLAPVSTEHRLSSCEQRLAMLEQATGVPQPDEVDKVISSSRKPLVEQIVELTEDTRKAVLADWLDGLTKEAWLEIGKVNGYVEEEKSELAEPSAEPIKSAPAQEPGIGESTDADNKAALVEQRAEPKRQVHYVYLTDKGIQIS